MATTQGRAPRRRTTTNCSCPCRGAGNLDECLLGVFFLSRFDASTHGLADLWRKLRASPVHHYHGAMALLQYWQEHLRDERDGAAGGPGPSPVIKESRRGLLRYLLMHGLDVPGWMKDGEIFDEAGFELVHDRVTVRTADLRHRVLRLLQPTEIPSEPGIPMAEVLSDLNSEAQDLDRMLRDWVRQFQRSWLYEQHTLPPSDDPKQAQRVPSPSKVYTYSKLSYALLWSKYAALRLLVNDTHLKIVSLCSEALVATDPSIERQCQLVAEQMADIVVSSNAFIMGDLHVASTPLGGTTVVLNEGSGACQRGYRFVTWPLSVACSLESVDTSQRLWCKWQLRRVGRQVGIKLFEEYQPNRSFRLDENRMSPGDYLRQ
ncbi:uncharacterized protein PG986_006692 [Apiospora aurea]|uniref:Uncharacterized protein n=1 Tax=Apiospora aurea TaxID=335848 RepID=A0ABR1QAG9_9PEZI